MHSGILINMPYSIINNYEHLPDTELLETNTDVMAAVSSLEGDILSMKD